MKLSWCHSSQITAIAKYGILCSLLVPLVAYYVVKSRRSSPQPNVVLETDSDAMHNHGTITSSVMRGGAYPCANSPGCSLELHGTDTENYSDNNPSGGLCQCRWCETDTTCVEHNDATEDPPCAWRDLGSGKKHCTPCDEECQKQERKEAALTNLRQVVQAQPGDIEALKDAIQKANEAQVSQVAIDVTLDDLSPQVKEQLGLVTPEVKAAASFNVDDKVFYRSSNGWRFDTIEAVNGDGSYKISVKERAKVEKLHPFAFKENDKVLYFSGEKGDWIGATIMKVLSDDDGGTYDLLSDSEDTFEKVPMMNPEEQRPQLQPAPIASSFTTSSQEAAPMKSALLGQLERYTTEEGNKEHEKAVKDEAASSLKDAAEDMEWLSSVARDGVMDFGNGNVFPLIDKKSSLGLLPKGLPDFPTDPKERREFIEHLPVSASTYSSMLALKKDPSKLMNVAKDDFKSALSSLMQESEKPQSLVQQQETVAEKQQKTIEVIKAAPKPFKQALKRWESVVPRAAAVLLQTNSDESGQAALDLHQRTSHLHKRIFHTVDQAHNKAALLTVAQNRITSLLMRQAEATIKDFDALDGCTDSAKDFSGAMSRCLCVAGNICHKMQHASTGDTCSIASSTTCMAPQNSEEASETTTV